ncbi:hypothetical protein JCM15765_00580 [Paradesulfitobacterium aromaticivorans]
MQILWEKTVRGNSFHAECLVKDVLISYPETSLAGMIQRMYPEEVVRFEKKNRGEK